MGVTRLREHVSICQDIGKKDILDDLLELLLHDLRPSIKNRNDGDGAYLPCAFSNCSDCHQTRMADSPVIAGHHGRDVLGIERELWH